MGTMKRSDPFSDADRSLLLSLLTDAQAQRATCPLKTTPPPLLRQGGQPSRLPDPPVHPCALWQGHPSPCRDAEDVRCLVDKLHEPLLATRIRLFFERNEARVSEGGARIPLNQAALLLGVSREALCRMLRPLREAADPDRIADPQVIADMLGMPVEGLRKYLSRHRSCPVERSGKEITASREELTAWIAARAAKPARKVRRGK